MAAGHDVVFGRRQVRILLSIHHPLNRDSGAAGVIMRIGREYQRLGHEVRIASHNDLPASMPRVAREVAFPFLVACMARSWRPDVIDASSGDAWLAFSQSDVPALLRVTHSHGLEHLSSAQEIADETEAGRPIPLSKRLWRHGLRLRMVARSFQKADLSLVLNDAEAQRLTAMGVPDGQIRRTRLGSDHAGRLPSNAPRDPFSVVQIGTYSRRKGVDVVAEAMSRTMLRSVNVTMTFIGVGVPRERVLADYPANLHSRIAVVSRYRNEDLPGLLAARSVCLMPSLFEGYGIAKLEAMACGLAVIVSDDPGACTDVINGLNGLIVPRGNALALSTAVRELTERSEVARRLGRAGAATAASFTWEAVAAERISFYREHERDT